MTTSARPEISCPSCGSVVETGVHELDITCSVCNMEFALAGHLCPSCANYHEEERAACEECGSPLIRLCRNCRTANWTGDDSCIICGEAIDLLSQVEASSTLSTVGRLDKQMTDARDLKMTEEEASKKRMAELMAIEEARQADLLRQRARQERHERRLLIIVFTAVLLFMFGLIVYALLST